MTASRRALCDRIRAVLVRGPQLELAVLFGSGAKGRLRGDSDIDVAVLPSDRDLPLAAELQLQADLARAMGRNVDLVRIDRAPTLVRWQVARHGVPILERTTFSFARFVAETASEYLELAPALAVAGDRFRARLAGRTS